MKKLISIMSAIIMISGLSLTTFSTAEEKTGKPFDEGDIVFSFGIISDIHLDKGDQNGNDSETRFKKALNMLKSTAEKSGRALDSMFLVGDMTNVPDPALTDNFKKIYEDELGIDKVPSVYCLGGYHDIAWDDIKTRKANLDLIDRFGKNWFSNDIDPEMAKQGCRHCVFNGYHVLTMQQITEKPITYSDESKKWLDETLDKLTKKNPEQFVFLLVHPMIENTVYGSDLGPYWATSDLTDILKKYPQLVVFSGHLHFPLNDPRSIMQKDFTAVGTGSVRYMAIESANYEKMYSLTIMQDRYEFSQGLLGQIDAKGNLRIRRLDFYNNSVIGEDWILPHPSKDGSHLNKYSRESREAKNAAPVMSEDSLTITLDGNKEGRRSATLTMKSGTDDEFVHHYVITEGEKDTGITVTYKILSDFYKHPDLKGLNKEWTLELGKFKPGHTYTVTAVAVDSWGKESNTVKKDFTVPGEWEEDGTIPAPYADFDFSGGKLAEKTGNVTIENNSAVIKKAEVTVKGEKRTLDTLQTKTGEYAMCRFNKINDLKEMSALPELGSTIEGLFYVPKGKNAQGIICGTQEGGWGLAVDTSNRPYFLTGSGKRTNGYNQVTAPEPLKEGELTHVVAVCDYPEAEHRMYINGKLVARYPIKGSYKNSNAAVFNKFCLGTGISADFLGNAFQSDGLILAKATIYDKALNDTQVKNLYDSL